MTNKESERLNLVFSLCEILKVYCNYDSILLYPLYFLLSLEVTN